MRWAAILLVLLLAGCTRPPADDASPAQDVLPTADDPVASFVAPPTRRIPVALALADAWIRPQDVVFANATASGASYEWYIATRNPLAVVPDAGPFPVAADDTITLAVRGAGRHVFALDDATARVSVSIAAGSTPLQLSTTLVEEDGKVRFAPDELVGGAGSVLRVTNALDVSASVRRVDAMLPLDGRSASIAFEMPAAIGELGDYDVVVVARDGAGGVGTASARLVYDNRKPDPMQEFGPYTGSFRLPPVPEPQVLRHEIDSAHPFKSLEMTLTVASQTPGPARLRATLLGPDGNALGSIEEGALALADLPAGAYAVEVEQVEGALVDYVVEVRGEWRLVPPSSFFKNV